MSIDTPFLRILLVVFCGSLAVQIIAFLRQLVIAAAFGIDRSMDLYLLVFAVASVVAFSIGSVLENAGVPMLVSRRDARDDRGFEEIANRLVVLSFAISAAAAVVFMLATPLFARFVATGLTVAEAEHMQDIAWWFLPWVLVCIPYYATGSLHKARGNFRRFMTAEIIVTIVSLAVIWFWRPGVHAIALAYGIGYGAGWLTMLPGSGISLLKPAALGGAGRGIRRQIVRIAVTNQMATLGTIADRYLASHLPAGSIAAGSYASLITGQVNGLLGFRDAFMVPLSQPEDRAGKLERMLIGLIVLSVPAAVFLSWQAEPIVSILLERGRFDKAASGVAGMMLAIQAWAIPVGVILLPMYRMLQILDRMRFSGYLLLAGAVVTFVLGNILIFALDMGLLGYLLTGVITSHITFIVAAVQLRMAGIFPDFRRIGGYWLFAVGASLAAAAVASVVPVEGHRLLQVVVRGGVFGTVYCLACLMIIRQLTGIVQVIRGQ